MTKEELYQELDLESLRLRRWYRKFEMFCKICISKSSQYLFKLISEKNLSYVTRNADNTPLFKTKHNFYKSSFIPSAIIEWNNLDSNLRNSKIIIIKKGIFKNNILILIRLKPVFFNYCNLEGIRICRELSHSREHKFRYNF